MKTTKNIEKKVVKKQHSTNSTKCDNKKCPIHGNLSLHGRTMKGIVLREVFHNTTTIEFPRQIYISKYERFEKRRTRIKVHIPSCMDVSKGNFIAVKETRPISKTKNFVVTEVIKK